MFRIEEDRAATAPDWARLLQDVLAGDLPLEIHFQPVVDLARGTVTGFEALSRFPSAIGQGPDRWFAAAAAHGVGGELEQRAVAAILAHRPALAENCFLSVNVSPTAVCTDGIQQLLLEEGDLRGLVIEITEQSPVEDYEALAAALAPLRENGAAIAIDDAGAGYSSMRHIVALEPEFVKLDRSLVSGVDTDARKTAAISALGAFAGELDAWVVAEGIETATELGVLSDLKLPLAQGFLLGRPAADMLPLNPALQRIIRERASRDGHGVGALMQMVTSVGPDEPSEAGSGHGPTAEVAVRVDEYGRPVHLLVKRGDRIEQAPVLSTDPGTPARELALRAMARDSGMRFLPATCCDGRGRLLGIVPIERVVVSLARD